VCRGWRIKPPRIECNPVFRPKKEPAPENETAQGIEAEIPEQSAKALCEELERIARFFAAFSPQKMRPNSKTKDDFDRLEAAIQ
jgi:hypothetical protein